MGQVCLYTPVISVLRKPKQEDHCEYKSREFQDSWDYTDRPHINTTKNTETTYKLLELV